MAAADYATVAQQIYMAYFGRPADYYGLQNIQNALNAAGAPTTMAALTSAYKTNAGVKAIVDGFATSEESTALYTGNTAQFINAIYNNVLNRNADVAGLNFWVAAVESKTMTRAQAAQEILAAAVKADANPADKALVDNKIALAKDFTTALGESAASIVAYSGNAAAASVRDVFHGVTADTTQTDFAGTIVTTVEALIANTVPVTNTSLTANVDTLVGTAANDTFNAIIGGAAPTLNDLDSIDGGAGNNTLSIRSVEDLAGGAIAALGLTVKNVDTLTVSAGEVAAGAAIVLTNADTTGFKTVNAIAKVGNGNITVGSTDATSVSTTGGDIIAVNAAAATKVSINGAGGAAAINSDALTTLNLTSTTAAATVTAAVGTRALTINTKGVTGAVSDVNATGVTVNNTGADSAFALTATAAKSIVLGGTKALDITTLSAAAATKLSIVGAGGVTVNATPATLVTAIDASASTGKNNVTLDATKQSYKGGAGADTVTIGAAAAFDIDGGAGSADVLVLNAAAGFAFGSKVTGFEVLGVGALANGAFDVGSFTALQHGATAGAVTFNGVANNSTLSLLTGTNQNTTVNLASVGGTSDVLNLVIKGGATIAGGVVTAAGVETINLSAIDTTGDGAAAHTITVTAADATALNVSGDTGVTITATGSTKIATFVSTNTDGVSYTSLNTTTAVSLTGGAGDDTLIAAAGSTKVATINGGAGKDIIVGGAGKDVLDGGDGDDTITGGANADTLKGGAGNDVFKFVLATDSAPGAFDTISDFTAKTADVAGDTIFLADGIFGAAIGAFNVTVASNGSLALAALGSATKTPNTVNVALDSATGTLYIDGNGTTAGLADGTADLAIILTGVTTLTAAAFAHGA